MVGIQVGGKGPGAGNPSANLSRLWRVSRWPDRPIGGPTDRKKACQRVNVASTVTIRPCKGPRQAEPVLAEVVVNEGFGEHCDRIRRHRKAPSSALTFRDPCQPLLLSTRITTRSCFSNNWRRTTMAGPQGRFDPWEPRLRGSILTLCVAVVRTIGL